MKMKNIRRFIDRYIGYFFGLLAIYHLFGLIALLFGPASYGSVYIQSGCGMLLLLAIYSLVKSFIEVKEKYERERK